METIKEEIQQAAILLGLSSQDLREVPEEEARKIYNKAISKFVTGGERRWWWEAFSKKSESIKSKDDKGFQKITQIVPDPEEHIWFIAEENHLDFYPVYEASPKAIQQVVGECYGFEYYLISKDFNWLLCEDHHGYFHGIGTEIIKNIKKIAT